MRPLLTLLKGWSYDWDQSTFFNVTLTIIHWAVSYLILPHSAISERQL